MSSSFPIKINHTLTNLPTKLSELETLTKASLESSIDQLPQKVNDKTLVNNVEITGKDYQTISSKKTYSANTTSDLVDLTSITGDKNKVYSYKGDDFVFSKGSSNQTDTGDGNDTVILSGDSNLKTYLGNGDDLLIVLGNKNQIGDKNIAKYGEGNDSVAISGKQNTVYTGSGDDSALITGESSTLDSGTGNDKVAVSGKKNIIKTYTGNDIVSVEGSLHDVDTDRGDDEVQVKGDSNIIKTGTGNDTITIYGKKNKVQTGDGDDQATIDNLTEGITTYTAEANSIDLGKGNDKAIINSTSGTFIIDGGIGTNTLKLTNIDINQYYGNYDNNVLELFKANGTGESLKINLKNVQSVEFSGTTVYSLEELTAIQGKTIQFNSSTSTGKVKNLDGKSNVLQLDFDFSKVTSVKQTSSNKFTLNYLDQNSNSKTLSLEGIFHLKTTEGYSIDLTQTPDFKTISADISSFKTSSTRGAGSNYTAKIFNPSSAESYTLDLDVNKDFVLALDTSNPIQLKTYSASTLVFETYGNSTSITPGILDNTILTNADDKTNVADFSGIKTENIHRIERLKHRENETYDGVIFSPTSPYFSTLPSSLSDDINLTFDGVQDTDTIVNAYNLANPTKTISHNGVGTDILAAGSLSLNNTEVLNNQYRVIFDDGVEKKITLDRYNFIKTAEGHQINIEKLFDSLKNGLDKELANVDTTASNYNASDHDGLKNTQFARGSFNVLSEQNDSNKYDALAALGGATYNLLPASGHSITPIATVTSTPASITPSNANLIDGNAKNFFSTAKKSVSAAENFILDLGAPTQFSKIQIAARADSSDLFPSSFNILAGNDVNNLTSLGTITSVQAESGYTLSTPTTAKFIKVTFNNKQLSTTSEYYAEIGEVAISDPTIVSEITHTPLAVSDFSSQDGANLATNAIDLNNTTFWKTTDSVGQTTESLVLDLSSTKSITKLRLRPASGATNFFPTDFSIYTGDDPFNLTLAKTVTNFTTIDPLFNDFSFTEASGRYVKINAKSRLNSGSYSLKLAEIAVIGNNASATIPVTLNSVSSTESANPSSDVKHINDGNVNTFYSSPVNSVATSQSLTFDLGSSQTLTGLNFSARPGYEGLFPTINNIYIDNAPVPVTAVTGLIANGTNQAFNSISGRYIKVDFTSKQNGTTGNYYSQIAEAEPVFSVAVNNKPEVVALASSLQSSLKFTANESGYEIDEATKGLYSLRIASILRNRSDILDKIKASGLEVQVTSKTFIPNGTKSVSYGGLSFTPNSSQNTGQVDDYTLIFDGIQDTDTVVNNFNLVNPTRTVSHNGLGTEILAAGSISLNNNAEGLASFTQGSNKTYKIQLSADSLFAGAYDNEDGKAVDLHETIHILDFLDGTADGNPVLINNAEKLTFGTARSNLFAPLSLPTPLPPLGEGLLYNSGADDPTRIANALSQGYDNSREFLAYASTVFFERADELVALGADGLSIYNKLSNYFGLATNVADPDTNVFTNVPPVL